MQWLVTGDEVIRPIIPHNSDAAFKRHTNASKPSDILLHYNYGAAAIKIWGMGKTSFGTWPNLLVHHRPNEAKWDPQRLLTTG
jgi:hypothetical protein